MKYRQIKATDVSDFAFDIPKNHYEDWQLELAENQLKNFDPEDNNLIDVLHFYQDSFGYIDKALIPLLAKFFNLSKAEVHGVISFYHDFRSTTSFLCFENLSGRIMPGNGFRTFNC